MLHGLRGEIAWGETGKGRKDVEEFSARRWRTSTRVLNNRRDLVCCQSSAAWLWFSLLRWFPWFLSSAHTRRAQPHCPLSLAQDGRPQKMSFHFLGVSIFL